MDTVKKVRQELNKVFFAKTHILIFLRRYNYELWRRRFKCF